MFRIITILASVGVLIVAGCATTNPRPTTNDVTEACAGVPDADAKAGLAELRGSVDRVDLIHETTKTKPFYDRAVGADIHVRAKPGMTQQWLARVVQCQLVNDAANGRCNGSECALGLPIASADVSPTATGFTIALRSSDPGVARELATRSKSTFDAPTAIATAAQP